MNNLLRSLSLVAVVTMLFGLNTALAKTDKAAVDKDETLKQSRILKESSAQLNADLIYLEREILYPTKTQLGVFVAMDEGAFFDLRSVEIFINGASVGMYKYKAKEVYAIQKGGKHRVYMGNYDSGDYSVKAVIKGVGPHGRAYRRTATAEISKKSTKNMHLEVNVVDGSNKYRPDFEMKEWD